MKLEKKHICPYLPYELEIQTVIKGSFTTESPRTIIETLKYNDINSLLVKRYRVISCKPILRPLSDLLLVPEGETDTHYDIIQQDICSLFEINAKELYVHTYLTARVEISKSYEIYQYLFENHFDVFGLIDEGLAIDINTLTNGELAKKE